MKSSIKVRISALFVLLILGGCSTGLYQPSAQALQQRQAAMEQSDHLIVPGQRIGPIRIGMGMDEVEAILGKHDGGRGAMYGQGALWTYVSLNLQVGFDNSSAPSVTYITTSTWPKEAVNFGTQRFAEDYPVATVFQLSSGIGLGATSFEVKRAYGSGYKDPGNEGLMMDYDNMGLSFRVTQEEHRVVEIYVKGPQ